MKTIQLVAVFGLTVAALSGCGPRRPVLHVYIWDDYLDPGLIAGFERLHDCRVKIDTFDSNETMYAKVKTGKTGYDIIVPSSYQASLMARNNMLRRIDMALLPNVTLNFDDSFQNVVLDPKMTYSVPFAFSFTGIAYRKDKIGGAVLDSWACFDNPAFAGHISLLGDYRETIGAALKFLGYSLNTTASGELQKAKEVILCWKKNITKFDNENYKKNIVSGELRVVHGYNSDILQVMILDEENIGFAFPKEGFAVACDEMVIPVTAKESGLAHAFINFLYDPDNACRNMQYTCAPMPNRQGLARLPENFRDSPALLPFPEIIAKAETITDVGEANDLYLKIWDEITAEE
jgi:Spermidine/putrescine-binding periplasmic protein